MFLAKSFTVPVEPVQKTDIHPSNAKYYRCYQSDEESHPATHSFEAPGALIVTQPVEAPSVTSVMQPTGQDVILHIAADRPELQPLGPASHTYPCASGRSVVQPSDPTGQTVAD